MDIHQLAGDPAAAPVFAALTAAKWRKARDLAKDLCKKDRARFLPLLIEANVGLAREMQSCGLQKDAEPVLAYLQSICPPEVWNEVKRELEQAPSMVVPAQSSRKGEADPAPSSPQVLMATSWPVVLKAAEAGEKGLPVSAAEWAAVDVAVSAFIPVPTQEPGSLGERVAAELEVIHLACAATAEGRWEDAQTGLRALARQSVFQHWRMFLRGVRHHFQREAEQARRCFATLPACGALARAAVVIAGGEAAPGTSRTVSGRAKAEWWLAVSGQRGEMAAVLSEAQAAWLKPDMGLVYDILAKAFGKDFPTLQPTLGGLMTAAVMPLRAPHGAVEEKRADQWSKMNQRFAPGHKNEAQINSNLLRALCLRDAPVMAPHDVFQEWRMVMKSVSKQLGPSAVRDSVGWLWLGEQMMQKPLQMGFFSRQEIRHRHGEHARTALLKAVECDPTHEAAGMMLLRFYQERGDTSERNKLLDELSRRFPENKEVLTQTGMLAAERKAFTKALPSLRKACALDPLDRNAQAALVRTLILQARELTQKKRPVDAVWAEIEALAHETPGPHYHSLSRWSQRMRRAVLEHSDTLAAEALALAPSPMQALFFERLMSPLYKCGLRAGWQQAWNEALRLPPGWRLLADLVEVARYCCVMKGFGWPVLTPMRALLEDVLAATTRHHLLTDPEGVAAFIQSTSTHDWPDDEHRWVGPIMHELRHDLAQSLTSHAKKKTADPWLRFAALLLESDHFAFVSDKAVKRRLADIIAEAKQQGMQALVTAAVHFQAGLEKHHAEEEWGDDFEDAVDDWAPPPPTSGQERMTDEDMRGVPPQMLPLIMDLAAAIIEGDLAAIARLRAEAVAGGMSGALFDNFVRTGPKLGGKKSRSSAKNPQSELDLF